MNQHSVQQWKRFLERVWILGKINFTTVKLKIDLYSHITAVLNKRRAADWEFMFLGHFWPICAAFSRLVALTKLVKLIMWRWRSPIPHIPISCFEMRTRSLLVIISVDTNEKCKLNFSGSNRHARWYNIFTMVLEKHPSDLELHYESSTPTSQEPSSSIFQSCESGSVTFNQISTFLSDPGPIIVYACQ